MKKSPASVPRFTRVELENWRNFIHVSAPLQRRAFLVGANASGKSNFLKVFRFLRDICTVGGGFQAAVANFLCIPKWFAGYPRCLLGCKLAQGGKC